MKIDLFSTTIFQHLKDDFGIYDFEIATVVPFENGIAKIQNSNKHSIFFIPLDKNIECRRTDGNMESQCDALLICQRYQDKFDFYFIELKEVRSDWISGGTQQLKTTIQTFKNNYDLTCLSKKIACLANKKHPYYQSSHKELMEKFRHETGFRLNICANISIK